MTNDNGSAAQRLVDALRDPDRLYDRDQLAFLMGTAMRWGYEARVDEENAEYPPPPVFVAGEWITMAERDAYRKRLAADRTQRYAGGPVEVW